MNTNPLSSSTAIEVLFCPNFCAILSLDLLRLAGGEAVKSKTCLFVGFVLTFGGDGVVGGESGYSFVCASFRLPVVVVVVLVDLRLLIVGEYENLDQFQMEFDGASNDASSSW